MVRVPAVQLDVPEGVKPVSHVGVQVAPLAREAVHSPSSPLVGAAVSHGSGGQRAFGEQVAAVRVPVVQLEVPETMKRLVDEGANGIYNGRGFYDYTPEESEVWKRKWEEFGFDIRELADKYLPLDNSCESS